MFRGPGAGASLLVPLNAPHAIVPSAIRFLDAHGFAWQAVEVAPADLAVSSGTLYFFSGGSTRRLDLYPDDWRACGWEELDRLCARATVMSVDPSRRHHDEQVTA